MEALALAGGGARRRLSSREEELLGLLAGFPDGGSGRELSFSDLIDAGARPSADDADHAAPAPREDRAAAAALSPSPGRHEPAAASKQQRQQAARRQRARRSGGGGGGSSRGSCGGSGDGVLLNFYVPGLLTRSMTAPRPGRGPLSPGAGQGAPPKAATAAAAAGKASRTRGALGIGCWPTLWGRGRGHGAPPPARAVS
ncbi:unnamed protein product [Urochloa decumbens]|uniref:Uncharacterized protein n=1 Tax=Urochloa decumbens TaxID=240449 RepID=A0ABC8VNH7_9POAL